MAGVAEAIISPVENLFDKMGMMQGDAAPLLRAGTGAALGAAYAYGAKPSFAFNDDGTAKPWYFTAGTADQANSTYVTAWMIVAFPAVVFGVMI